ncbi:MAG: DUF5366 family protein [Bacillus sp. (in: firmicutes)]
MKNTYLTSYFPIFSIIFFSIAFATRVEFSLLSLFKYVGMYNGLLEFFTETGIKLALLIVLCSIFFMILAALKLITDTLNQLSLLFFSNDSTVESLTKARKGSFIYFIGSILSLFGIYSYLVLVIIFILTTLIYFVYFVNTASTSLSISGIVFFILFQVSTWAVY